MILNIVSGVYRKRSASLVDLLPDQKKPMRFGLSTSLIAGAALVSKGELSFESFSLSNYIKSLSTTKISCSSSIPQCETNRAFSVTEILAWPV